MVYVSLITHHLTVLVTKIGVTLKCKDNGCFTYQGPVYFLLGSK